MRAGIDSSIRVVDEILQISTLPFFPDYTGHGIDHLSSVLEIIDKLIAEQSKPEFTAEDAAVLTFSVLLHDLALHLSESGFLTLLSKSDAPGQPKGRDWAATFADFISEAKHWDERKLAGVVGLDEYGAPRSLVRNPMNHYSALTDGDRKLIGEFIRRHHATLAYEFATIGFPGLKGQRIEFSAFNEDLREVAGHVARSHGLPLEKAITSLNEAQISPIEFVGVHPVYLMGLLRVADFLELGSDRAPLIAFQYKDIASPVSRKEWRTNQAFRKISWGNPEPESIQIPANRPTSSPFLELKKWLSGIQEELDTTWAVYGEIYGAHPRFSLFQLTVRRVHSNILDAPETFARNSSFVPKQVNLGVGGPDVLKLFIEPLYGKKPEFGIRELLQNSVDAVRERRVFEERTHQPDENNDVVIWLDDPDTEGNSSLTITDQGIGMTEEVIAEYFMKAGASFRRSIAWKKQFEAEKQEDHPSAIRASVLRSGRFGIGVLAAFLLGDQIEVWTRHITSPRGIRFSVSMVLEELDTDSIQLNYDNSIQIGTTVTVKVTKVHRDPNPFTATNIFSGEGLWDWYCLKEPSVRRYIGASRKELAQHVIVPPENGPLPQDWHAVPSSDYRTVHVYTGGRWSSIPALVCNGIKVTGSPSIFEMGVIDYASSGRWQSLLFPGQGIFALAHRVSPSLIPMELCP